MTPGCMVAIAKCSAQINTTYHMEQLEQTVHPSRGLLLVLTFEEHTCLQTLYQTAQVFINYKSHLICICFLEESKICGNILSEKKLILYLIVSLTRSKKSQKNDASWGVFLLHWRLFRPYGSNRD